MQRLEVRLHLWLCPHCKKYAQQLEILRQSFRNLVHSQKQNITESRIKNLEDKILDKIKK